MTESDFFLLPMEQTPRLQFDYLFHNPNPAIDEYLHGDHVHTNEDGEEVVSPGTPDRPVVIEPEPDPDPDPPNANPGPAPDADAQPAGDGMIEPLTETKLVALTRPIVPTGGVGVFRGGDGDEFIFSGASKRPDYDCPDTPGGYQGDLADCDVLGHYATYGVNDEDYQLYGGDGNDVLVGGASDAYLDGGPGNDYLFGGQLDVYELGAVGDDLSTSPARGDSGGYANILMGGPGNDYLHDGGLIDILNGGPGNDHLVADEADVAVLIGGPGRDVFDVSSGRKVKIMDFQDGVDKILLFVDDGDYSIYGRTEYLKLHQLAARAGVQFDMGWIATEVDNGVTLPLDNQHDGNELTIEGAYLPNLQFEVVGGDLFIV